MHWLDWCIMILPFTLVLALAVYAKKYARDVVDFLAAGRVAGRYVICVGDMAAGLSVISLVASCEATYRAGSAMGFWGTINAPLGMLLALLGYCTYRYRATKALSFGQFLEERYSRSFRVTAAVIRNLAEMVTNAIGPAIAANFFIYFLGLPHKIQIFGVNLPCFAIIVFLCLTFAMIAIWPAGRISLLITDTFQGLVSYPIFVLIACYIFFKFNWHDTMVPVMMDRVPGESFLNPFDVSKLRDFNMFALGVTITASLLQRASWFGNDTSNSGRNPHEQKMAGVLGTWRNGFAYTMVGLVTLLVITVMNHDKFLNPSKDSGLFSSHETRLALLQKVADEAVPDAQVRDQISADLAALPPPRHNSIKAPVPAGLEAEHEAYWTAVRAATTDHTVAIPEPSEAYAEYLAVNMPLSQQKNIDTAYIDTARNRINANLPADLQAEADAIAELKAKAADDPSVVVPTPSPELAAAQGANAKQAQKVRTLYGQMMMPMALRRILPVGLTGLFALLMIMLLISTDDSRIFNASSTWVQDVILPWYESRYKKVPDSKQHILILRLASLAVAIFFFVVAIFFSQLDYINMFTTIMCSVWLGGGGSVMIFGLYSRFGNTVGAWCSLAFGSGFSVLGLFAQRCWSDKIIPFLNHHGWTDAWYDFFTAASRPFYPWVDWSCGGLSHENVREVALQQFAEKFPMNSTEIYGISMVLSVAAYCIGSWIAIACGKYKPFNLDQLLHRGDYADPEEKARLKTSDAKKISIFSKIIGITSEYTRGDRIIAWSVFCYTIVYQIILCFAVVLIWNSFSTSWAGHHIFSALALIVLWVFAFRRMAKAKISGIREGVDPDIEDYFHRLWSLICCRDFIVPLCLGIALSVAMVKVVFPSADAWAYAKIAPYISPWPKAWWGEYYYVVHLIVPICIGLVSTVWFMWGGIKDCLQLFRDLDARVIDVNDNGMVWKK